MEQQHRQRHLKQFRTPHTAHEGQVPRAPCRACTHDSETSYSALILSTYFVVPYVNNSLHMNAPHKRVRHIGCCWLPCLADREVCIWLTETTAFTQLRLRTRGKGPAEACMPCGHVCNQDARRAAAHVARCDGKHARGLNMRGAASAASMRIDD
jgi:hypothetical protein